MSNIGRKKRAVVGVSWEQTPRVAFDCGAIVPANNPPPCILQTCIKPSPFANPQRLHQIQLSPTSMSVPNSQHTSVLNPFQQTPIGEGLMHVLKTPCNSTHTYDPTFNLQKCSYSQPSPTLNIHSNAEDCFKESKKELEAMIKRLQKEKEYLKQLSNKRKYECSSTGETSSSKIPKRNREKQHFSSFSLIHISRYLDVASILYLSLVCSRFNKILDCNAVWNFMFSRKYSKRFLEEKDPIMGGDVLRSITCKFSSKVKAHFALKQSLSKFQILSQLDVFLLYKEVFQNNNRFEETFEMKQIANIKAKDRGKGFSHFFKQALLWKHKSLVITRLKNPLTNQIFKMIDTGENYGAIFLENDIIPFACISQGTVIVTWREKNCEGLFADVDFIAHLQRMYCRLWKSPEMSAVYLGRSIPVNTSLD